MISERKKILKDIEVHNSGIDLIVQRLIKQGMSDKVINSFLKEKIDPDDIFF